MDSINKLKWPVPPNQTKQKGICQSCCEEPVVLGPRGGKSFCQACIEIQNEARQRKRQTLLCTKCKKVIPGDKRYKQCEPCRIKDRHRSYLRRQQRNAAKTCRKCDKLVDLPNSYLYCKQHTKYHYTKNRTGATKDRRGKWICKCGRDATPGYRTCEKCYWRAFQANAKWKEKTLIAGFCVYKDCQNQAINPSGNIPICRYHSDLLYDKSKQNYAKRIEKQRCVKCSAYVGNIAFKTCDNCRALKRWNERQKKAKANIVDRMAILYEAMQNPPDAVDCPRCGQMLFLDTDHSIWCISCGYDSDTDNSLLVEAYGGWRNTGITRPYWSVPVGVASRWSNMVYPAKNYQQSNRFRTGLTAADRQKELKEVQRYAESKAQEGIQDQAVRSAERHLHTQEQAPTA